MQPVHQTRTISCKHKIHPSPQNIYFSVDQLVEAFIMILLQNFPRTTKTYHDCLNLGFVGVRQHRRGTWRVSQQSDLYQLGWCELSMSSANWLECTTNLGKLRASLAAHNCRGACSRTPGLVVIFGSLCERFHWLVRVHISYVHHKPHEPIGCILISWTINVSLRWKSNWLGLMKPSLIIHNFDHA